MFLDGRAVPAERRQEIAARLGFAETVFVDDSARGELRIFTPAVELPLAGHPLVGTAWLLDREGAGVDVLRPPAGDVPTWREGDLTWIRARPEDAPPFELVRLSSAAAVDALDAAADDGGYEADWAWLDEAAGVVRTRVFAATAGVAEDEATGAAALRLAAHLGRAVEIRQGRGSVLYARPAANAGWAEVGGRAALVGRRAL